MKKEINLKLTMMSFLILLLLINFEAKGQSPESISVLEFDDDQTLFVGDSYGGYIYAYPMNEMPEKDGVSYNIRELDSKIAKALGTETNKIKITDLAVNPISKNAFISVHKISGKKYQPVILKITSTGQITNFDLKKNTFTKFKVNDAPDSKLVFWNRIPLRSLTFTDIEYHNGNLYVAGISNADFDASLRKIPYPFRSGKQAITTVEVFHTVHNQQETRSPIQTLEVVELNNEEFILAVYTCTPLVLFPLKDIQSNAHIVGKVVAELGYGNTPIDIKSFSAQDPQGNVQEVALVINKARGSMLFNFSDLAESNQKPGLTQAVGFNSAGTPFFQPAIGGTFQLENLDKSHLLTLRRNNETGETELLSYMKGFYFRLTDHISDYIYPDYIYGEEGEFWRPIQNILKVDEGHPETVVEKKN